MDEFITAIDFGSSKICIAVGECSAVGIRVCAYSERPAEGIVRGEILNIMSSLGTVKELVRDVERQMENQASQFKVSKVFVGISGKSIKCSKISVKKKRFNPEQTITSIELDEMLTSAFRSSKSSEEEIIHVIPQTYSIDDNKDLPSIEGMLGEYAECNYIVISCKTLAASNVRAVISRAGLELYKIILNPVAAAKSVLQDDEEELGTAVVDFGFGTTDLVILKERKVVYCASIPFGGDAITKDINQECKVSRKNAEKMKLLFGNCFASLAPENKKIGIPDDKGCVTKRIPISLLYQTIEARMKEIAATVITLINESGFSNDIFKIVLTGGASQIAQLVTFFKRMSGFSVRLGAPRDSSINTLSVEGIFQMKYAAVTGLILKGSEIMQREAESENTEVSESTEAGVTETEVIISEPEPDKAEKKNEKKDTGKRKKSKGSFFGTLFGDDEGDTTDDGENKA